jgi:hypothetical protein
MKKSLILCALLLSALNVLTAQNNAKLVNFKVELPASDFKKAFGNGSNLLHQVGFISRRSTQTKDGSISQVQNLIEFALGETESIINGNRVKHSQLENETNIKGYLTLTANVKKGDFKTLKINYKNGVIYSICLIKNNFNYILFE